MEEFGTQGYDGTSLESIASKAGITKGAVYWHFNGKSDLYNEVARSVTERYNSFMSRTESSGDPASDIRMFVEGILKFYVENERESRFFMMMMSEGKLDRGSDLVSFWADSYRSYRKLFSDLISDGIEKGSFTYRDPNMAAATIVGAIDGLVMQWMMDSSSIDLIVCAPVLADMMISGLRRTSS
jgi:TetR/AcrR family acrAB operon transcriptional repressor